MLQMTSSSYGNPRKENALCFSFFDLFLVYQQRKASKEAIRELPVLLRKKDSQAAFYSLCFETLDKRKRTTMLPYLSHQGTCISPLHNTTPVCIWKILGRKDK